MKRDVLTSDNTNEDMRGLGHMMMVFKDSTGHAPLRRMTGSATLIQRLGKKESGKYALITVAHNFKAEEPWVFKSAIFVLQRNDSK